MKHMAELQLSVVSDPDMKQQLSTQIMRYEENMERLYCEQFRLRCYISSLQNGELPNPKVSIRSLIDDDIVERFTNVLLVSLI